MYIPTDNNQRFCRTLEIANTENRYWYLQGAELPASITCNTWLVTQSMIPCSMIIPLVIAKLVITEQMKKKT